VVEEGKHWCSGRSSGFSLVEIAIVIAIGSLLMIGFLRYYSVQVEKRHFDITKSRMDEVRQALTLYAMTHERLPCPASPEVATEPLATPDGKAADSCAPDVKAPPTGVIVHNPDKGPDQQVWIGLVPTRDLRLDGDDGRDGWGDQFTYAVSRPLTFPLGMRGNPMPYGNITVVDQTGASLLDKPNSGRYVIVSHGPSGGGAWTVQGGRRPCQPGTLAFENCSGDAAFVMAPFSLTPGPTFFDNIVVYDNQNAGGKLVDRILVCSARYGFYIPNSPNADQDGCVVTRCNCMQFLMNGRNMTSPPTGH
jgi:type II secretory pathway pseudopilin PulG